MTGLDPILALVLVAALLGGIVNGLVGFGFSAIAGAILVRPLGPLEAVPLMMAYTVIAQSMGAVRLRSGWRTREVTPFCLGGVAGLALTLPLLATLDPHAFHLVFGSFLLLYGALALRTSARRSAATAVSRAERVAVGFVGGAIGALTALPSAAVVVWADRRGYGMERLRAMLQPYILVIQIAGLAGLWRAGLLDLDRLAPLVLTGLPALLLGHALGLRLNGLCDARRLRNAVLSVVMLSGGLMVVS